MVNGKIGAVNLEANAVETTKIKAEAVTGAKVTAQLTGLRLLRQVSGALGQGNKAGTYLLKDGGGTALPKMEGEIVSLGGETYVVNLNPADYEITGKATKMVLKITITTNATAPTGNWGVALFPAESSKGGIGKVEVKFGAAVAESEAKIEAPAKESPALQASSTFAFPAVKGYSLGLVLSGESAANSFTPASAQLYVKNE